MWVPALLLSVLVSEGGGVLTPVLQLQQGRLRGLRGYDGLEHYFGVPYATSERFRPPGPAPSWNGTFNAIQRYATCAQAISLVTLGTENCLQLDVHTPASPERTRRAPVLVFLHGGGYYYGSKAHYDPQFLVSQGTVAVIINYRVGVLGFLCVEHIANLGLKDQVAALKWIQNNIAAFGGDPDNVTIMGQSAGASAAGMHLLSPLSKGLFHKVILLSGSPLAPWAFNLDPLTPALEDARKLGDVETLEDVVRVFSAAPLRDLLLATRDTSINSKHFKYSPCVETNSPDPFFPDTPYTLFESGQFNKVPIMVGFTDVEGLLFYGLHSDSTLRDFDENFHDKVPSVFNRRSTREAVSTALRAHYFGAGAINRTAYNAIVNYYSDWIAYSSIDSFSALMARVSDRPVYNYMFTYEGSRNFAKMIFGRGLSVKGASHSDDIFYIFKPAGLSLPLTNQDKLFIDRLASMIAHFMKAGNPTPFKSHLLPVSWKARQSEPRYLKLGGALSMVRAGAEHTAALWQRLLCQYADPGYVACPNDVSYGDFET